MRVGTMFAGLLAMAVSELAAAQQATPPDADAGIAPFSARYVAEWRGITVGTSNLQLKHDAEPQRYLYKWTISARGIFRLVYSSDLTQRSWFTVSGGHARPDRYLAEEGTSSVGLNFDWAGGHALGWSENEQVDLRLIPGTQDLLSIQIEVMLDLENGNLPKTFHIIDKDKIKEFVYAREGTATISTALGPLDTVIVSSRQPSNDRILRMWFSPSRGYVPVQAERTRGGKLEFAMRIQSLNR